MKTLGVIHLLVLFCWSLLSFTNSEAAAATNETQKVQTSSPTTVTRTLELFPPGAQISPMQRLQAVQSLEKLLGDQYRIVNDVISVGCVSVTGSTYTCEIVYRRKTARKRKRRAVSPVACDFMCMFRKQFTKDLQDINDKNISTDDLQDKLKNFNGSSSLGTVETSTTESLLKTTTTDALSTSNQPVTADPCDFMCKFRKQFAKEIVKDVNDTSGANSTLLDILDQLKFTTTSSRREVVTKATAIPELSSTVEPAKTKSTLTPATTSPGGIECPDASKTCSENGECEFDYFQHHYICQCQIGFTGDGYNCIDVDECIKGTDNCLNGHICHNTDGSYNCSCRDGFSGDGFTVCKNTDECSRGEDNCHPEANCTNTEGSFTCKCGAGLTGDGVTCEDINECDSSPCRGFYSQCINTPGSFTCKCPKGFDGDGFNSCNDGVVCPDNSLVCSCDADCAYYPNLRRLGCKCKDGFAGDGRKCEDINECKSSPCHGFTATCENHHGNFTCKCPDGMKGDGINSCNDGVVCPDDSLVCSRYAECDYDSNLRKLGCKCKDGFIGDGRTCVDPNFRQRLVFQADYSVPCGQAMTNVTKRVILSTAQQNFVRIEEMCGKYCSPISTKQPIISCIRDSLRIQWPTGLVYDGNTHIKPEVLSTIARRLSSTGVSSLSVVILSKNPPIVDPVKDSVTTVLSPYCADNSTYNTQNHQCQ